MAKKVEDDRAQALVGPALQGAGALQTALDILGMIDKDKHLAAIIVDHELELRSLIRFATIEISKRV